MRNIPNNTPNFPNMLRKTTALFATVTLIGLALMLAMTVIMFMLAAGAIAWAYLWWKSRGLRKQMRAFPHRGAVLEGKVIEGEVIRVVDTGDAG